MATLSHPSTPPPVEILTPIRHWINCLEIHDPCIAHLICKLIPCTCPFERRFTLFGHPFQTHPCVN
nr:Mo-dependent nitrogenase C-terminal domain-containing protein [Leptothermofonsia sichuanensis]